MRFLVYLEGEKGGSGPRSSRTSELSIQLPILNQLARDLAEARRVFGLAQTALRPRFGRLIRIQQFRESGVEKDRRLLVKAPDVAAQLEAVLIGQPDV